MGERSKESDGEKSGYFGRFERSGGMGIGIAVRDAELLSGVSEVVDGGTRPRWSCFGGRRWSQRFLWKW